MPQPDFSLPTRQSWVAILMIIRKTVVQIIKMVWPVLVYGLFQRKGEMNLLIMLALTTAGILVISMIVSIIHYFRFSFSVQNEELVVQSGILNLKKLIIPFDRIQAINVEQNLIHQIFDVVKVKVDTAGSATQEVEIDAISHSTAEALKKLILSNPNTGGGEDSLESQLQSQEPQKKILHIDMITLLKAGLVENHLKSGGIIIAALFWVGQNLSDIGIDVFQNADEVNEVLQNLMYLGVLVIVFLLVSIIISLTKMLIVNYNLRFIRQMNQFKIISGLFNVKEVTAKDYKIQSLHWADNPLKRLLGFYDLSLKQAGSDASQIKNSIHIPAATKANIDYVVDQLYSTNESDIVMHSVEKTYLYRKWIFIGIFWILGSAPLYVFTSIQYLLIFQLLILYMLWQSYLSYRKHRYGYSEEFLSVKGGAFGNKATFLPIFKIQATEISQSPFQRRKGLCDCIIYNASGSTQISYIKYEDAVRVMDHCLYKVETSEQSWM